MSLSKTMMIRALNVLDEKLDQDVRLIVGGGGALILAHGLDLATHDIDAVPRGMDMSVIDPKIKEVALDLGITGEWLNPYFSTFAHTLPADYETRLIEVFKGQRLSADALGAEEMLIMKCFAGRPKDVSHARALLRKGVDVRTVEKHIEKLIEKQVPGADLALDFLDELEDA
jgi:hypothetical protein